MSEQHVRVAIVTGASSGIGREAAKALAAQGWRVIATGRDPARAAAAEAEIRAASHGAKTPAPVTMLTADLALMAEAEALADRIAALTPRVDVLINNAGGMAGAMVMTSEGLEANFAGNHLGPFVLTLRLLPLLRAAASQATPGAVRILNTASDASEMIPALNLDDMQNLAHFSVGAAYCSGKLANVLFARALATRLAGEGIVAHSVHPGTVDSNFFANAPAATRAHTDKMAKMSEAEGADTLIWLATADEPGQVTGEYWHRRALRTAHPLMHDPAFIDRFWDASTALVATARLGRDKCPAH